MKKTPLIWRILAGALISLLFVAALLLPMLSDGECAALIALAERGKPYVLGKAGPDSFDCSGLTKTVYSYFGYDLIHSAQFVGYDNAYETVEDAVDLRVGDLIFFDTVSDKDLCDHVGIWLGGNRFVHASSSVGKVMVSLFNKSWHEKYSWGKRLLHSDVPFSLEKIANMIHSEENP